jgi:SAM-dependent methyltransferase
MNSTIALRPANFTRTSRSLVAKYLKSGRLHLLPIYWTLRQSDLAREGIERSGSYRFADHLYRNVPSGRGLFGRWLDRRLLNLPSARGMRARYSEAVKSMQLAFAAHAAAHPGEPFRLLTVPCGIPRDIGDFVRTLAPEQRAPIEYTACDLDPEVIAAARDHLSPVQELRAKFVCGDALDAATLPAGGFHFISSTGLGEFLDDASLAKFYANVHRWLAPGGRFYTSATAWEPRSAWLLKSFELEAHYRDEVAFGNLLCRRPWQNIRLWHDATGLQTFVEARAPA